MTPSRSCDGGRRGTTLPELALVLLILGVLLALVVPPARRGEERRRVHGAALHAAAMLASARELSVAAGGGVALRIDTAGGTLRVTRGADTVRIRRLGELFGVRLASTRDSLAWDARGLGVGAANLTLTFRRGAAAETLSLSRLGRVRW